MLQFFLSVVIETVFVIKNVLDCAFEVTINFVNKCVYAKR